MPRAHGLALCHPPGQKWGSSPLGPAVSSSWQPWPEGPEDSELVYTYCTRRRKMCELCRVSKPYGTKATMSIITVTVE